MTFNTNRQTQPRKSVFIQRYTNPYVNVKDDVVNGGRSPITTTEFSSCQLSMSQMKWVSLNEESKKKESDLSKCVKLFLWPDVRSKWAVFVLLSVTLLIIQCLALRFSCQQLPTLPSCVWICECLQCATPNRALTLLWLFPSKSFIWISGRK